MSCGVLCAAIEFYQHRAVDFQRDDDRYQQVCEADLYTHDLLGRAILCARV
jgi:hypothetical protein